MNEQEKRATLATVWMDMFCTGNSSEDEIEFYRRLAECSRDDVDRQAADVLIMNQGLLQYMEDNVEILFERAVQAVEKAKELYETP